MLRISQLVGRKIEIDAEWNKAKVTRSGRCYHQPSVVEGQDGGNHVHERREEEADDEGGQSSDDEQSQKRSTLAVPENHLRSGTSGSAAKQKGQISVDRNTGSDPRS